MLHRELIGAFSASSTCKYSGETPLTTLLAQGEGAERPAGPPHGQDSGARARRPGHPVLPLQPTPEPGSRADAWPTLLVLTVSCRRALLPLGAHDLLPTLPQLTRPRHSAQSWVHTTTGRGRIVWGTERSNFAFPVRSIDVSLSLSSPLGIRDSFFYFQWPHFVTCELRTQRLKESLAGTALILHRHSKASLDLIYVFFSKK